MPDKINSLSDYDLQSVFEEDGRFNLHSITNKKFKALKNKANQLNITNDELGEMLLIFIRKSPHRRQPPHDDMLARIYQDLKKEFPNLTI